MIKLQLIKHQENGSHLTTGFVFKQKFLKKCVIVFSTITLTLFYYINDPATFHFSLPCLLKSVTGLNCWGCGGQRAFHQILHGNYQQAFQLNALVFPIIILLSYVLIAELLQQKPNYNWLYNKTVQISTTVLVLTFTILRNI